MAEEGERSADVVVLPGIERRDLVGPQLDPAEVLSGVIEQGITDFVIVGRHRDGSLYVAGCTNDVDRVAGILFRGINFVANGFYDQGISTKDGPR